jgi:hypothetical protein
VAGGLIAGFVVLGFFLTALVDNHSSDSKSDTVGWVAKKDNFRLNLAREEWKENPDARLGLRCAVAVEKKGELIWVAIAAQDFGKRNARDSEMEKGAIERLENYFKEGELEWEPRAAKQPLAGQPVQRIVFQGQHDKVLFRGECYLLRYRGIGYWLFIWAPMGKNKKWQSTQKELEDMQSQDNRGFVLLDGRKGWEEQPPEMDKYRGSKYAFTIQGLKGLWEEFSAADEDAHGDLYLQRKPPNRERNPVKGVNVLVSVLGKKAGTTLKSAMTEAKDSLLQRLPDVGEKPKADAAPGQKGELGVERKVGNVPGRVMELQVINGELQFYALLAVVVRSKHVFIIQCQCPWKDRANWRGEFIQMLDTFNLETN